MRKIIEETVKNISLDKKSFTQRLKKMEKECDGDYYLKMSDDERSLRYNMISNMIENNIDGKSTYSYETQYNIFRLAKYLIWHKNTSLTHYQEYVSWYLWTVLHPYGNIRCEGWRLIDRIRMEVLDLVESGTYRKIPPKEAEENKKDIFPFLADTFMYLQQLEIDYQNHHAKKIDRKDIYKGEKFIHYSDTKDLILKSIRKGMSLWDLGNFDKIMDYAGYKPIYKADKPWFCGGRYLPKEMVQSKYIDDDGELDEASDEYMIKEGKSRIEKERKLLQEAFEIFIRENSIDLNFETVKKKIYNDGGGTLFAHREYTQFWMDIFDTHNIEPSQKLFDLIAAFWNYFPHKALKEKCPEELYNGL